MPYKVVTIASGFFQMDPASFALVSLVGRGVRYFFVAGAVFLFGPLIDRFINRNAQLAFAVFTALLLGGFVLTAWVL